MRVRHPFQGVSRNSGDTARVVGSGSPCLTAHRSLASAAPVRQCVHRPSLESERQAVSRKPKAALQSSDSMPAASRGMTRWSGHAEDDER